jgi:hypothetical protein
MILDIKEKHLIADSVANDITHRILELMNKLISVENPIHVLNELKKVSKSTFLQTKYIENKSNFVNCREIPISDGTYHYIPLIETLKSKLSQKSIYEKLVNEKSE